MGLIQTKLEIEYPEADGKPMGETDLHRGWMMRVLDLLSHRYRGQHFYVTSNLLVYYSEGNPHEFVVPDVFVAKECSSDSRRTYKVWEEGEPPTVVFEITSRSTRRDDQVFKPQVYAKIGVKELFLYDPTAEYLVPPLQGFRFSADGQMLIEADSSGALDSEELGLRLSLVGGELVMTDSHTGQRLLTEAEAERAEKEAERAARESAEDRAATAEAELRRLRERLGE